MSFAAPIALLALLLVPAGIALHAAARRRRRRHALRYPAVATVAAVLPGAGGWRRWVPPLLLALAAVALALALARPQRSVAVAVQRASVMLVMDGSRSMTAQDVQPSRIEAARRAAERFLDTVPSDLLVGMVGYNTVPVVSEAPTVEHGRIRAAVAALQADGGTATGDALEEALKRLGNGRTRGGRRIPAAIILLSDGKSTDGRDPVPVARRAGRLHIPIFTVALGTPGGLVPGGPFGVPLSVPPDPESLRQIARASGGQAYQVADQAELGRIYQRLGSRVGTRKVHREVTASFAGAGLLLLLGAVAGSALWRGRAG
jgi:Ca-activated chloride channel family protein